MARTHNRISSRVWTGRTARVLRLHPPYVRVFQFWLMTNESTIVEPYGLYHVDFDVAVLQIGGNVTRADLEAAMETLEGTDFCEFDHESEWVWIREMAAHQVLENYQPLKERDWRVRSAQKFYEGLPDIEQLGPFYEHYADLLRLENKRTCTRGVRGPRGPRGLEAPNPTPNPTPTRSLDPEDQEDLLGPANGSSTALVRPGAQQQLQREQFEAWWSVYPVKTGKGKAWLAWQKHQPPAAKAIDTTRAYCESVEWAPKSDGKRAIPYPTTWLNAGSWDDEPTPLARAVVPQLGNRNQAMVDRTKDF